MVVPYLILMYSFISCNFSKTLPSPIILYSVAGLNQYFMNTSRAKTSSLLLGRLLGHTSPQSINAGFPFNNITLQPFSEVHFGPGSQ